MYKLQHHCSLTKCSGCTQQWQRNTQDMTYIQKEIKYDKQIWFTDFIYSDSARVI